MGGQFTISTCSNIIALMIMMFILAFKLAGQNLEENFAMELYIVVVIFAHNFIIIPCLLGDLIERKFKDIHKMLRKISNKIKDENETRILDVNLEYQKLSCGLFCYNWSFVKVVKIKLWFLINLFLINYLNVKTFLQVISTEIIYLVIMTQFQLLSH